MAKIGAMPAQEIVDTFRGKLDFYQWCNLNIVRSWPQMANQSRNPYVTYTAQRFSYIAKGGALVSPEVQDLYKELVAGTTFCWRDYMVAFYINADKVAHLTEA